MTALQLASSRSAAPWFRIDRHAARPARYFWYSERFSRVEAIVTAMATAVRTTAASDQLSANGLNVRCDELRASAFSEGQSVLKVIAAAIETDREVIEAALAVPPPAPSTEIGLAKAQLRERWPLAPIGTGRSASSIFIRPPSQT